MSRNILKYLIIVFIWFGLVSCGGGGSGDIDSDNTMPVVKTNTDGNIVVSGKILVNPSTLSANQKVTLSNITFKTETFTTRSIDACILEHSLEGQEIDITNGAEIDYEVTIDGNCKDVNKIIFEADKIATFTLNNKEYKKAYRINKEIIFNNIDFGDREIVITLENPEIKIGEISTITIRLTDKNGQDIKNEEIVKVIAKSLDSRKFVLINDENEIVNEVELQNLSKNSIKLKGIESGTAKLLVESVVKNGSEYYKIKKEFELSIGDPLLEMQGVVIDLQHQESIEVDNITKFILEIRDFKTNELINGLDIKKVKVTSTQKLIKFRENNEDFKNYSFEFNESSKETIFAKSGERIGFEIIRVEVTIENNESIKNISKDFTIPIVSGLPASISIIYLESSFENGLYIDRYKIFATDKFNNPAKDGSKILVGAVSGLSKDIIGRDIYVGESSVFKGTIQNRVSGIEFSVKNTFFDPSGFFENVKIGETLIVLANKDKFDSSYLGGWTIKDKIDNSTLLLEGDVDINETGLSYVIGDEKRFDPCDGQPKFVNFEKESYFLNRGGEVNLTLKYPPFFVGKDVYLYVNSIIDGKRVGASMRKKLFGTGITADEVTCSNGEKCGEIQFTLNDSNFPLTYQDFTSENFIYEGDCNKSNINNIINTGCDGTIDLNISADTNGSCTIKWDGSIPYEH